MSIHSNYQQTVANSSENLNSENNGYTPIERTDEEVAAVVDLLLKKMPPNAQRFHQVCSLKDLEFSVRLYDSMD